MDRVVSVRHDRRSRAGDALRKPLVLNDLTKMLRLASLVPCGGRPRPFRGRPSFRIYMKRSRDAAKDEPVGIIISGGRSLSESAPRFSAYIWAPGPEEESVEGARVV